MASSPKYLSISQCISVSYSMAVLAAAIAAAAAAAPPSPPRAPPSIDSSAAGHLRGKTASSLSSLLFSTSLLYGSQFIFSFNLNLKKKWNPQRDNFFIISPNLSSLLRIILFLERMKWIVHFIVSKIEKIKNKYLF